MTLQGRLELAMAAKGIVWTNGKERNRELLKRIRLQRPSFHRQTVHKWFLPSTKELGADHLFLVADLLDCNPRWLALKDGEPQKPFELDLEQGRVVQIYRQLKPKHRDSWVRHGNELVEEDAETSPAKPFIRA